MDPGLRFAIPHNRNREQIRIVEGGAKRVREDVAKLTTLVDRARRGHTDVTRDPAGRRELPEQTPQAGRVLSNFWINLRVRPFQVHIRYDGRTTVAGAGQIDRIDPVILDEPVQVDVDEAQAGRRAPVAEQPRLDMLRAQGLA